MAIRMDDSHKLRLVLLGAILAFSSIFQMGYANAYPNTAIDGFRSFLNESVRGLENYPNGMSEKQFSWTWSAILNVYFIGFAVGSWVAVPIADRIGRKWCLLAGNLTNFFSALLASFAIWLLSPILYFVSRVIFAVAAAVSMNSLILLLQESSPTHLRGLMSFNAEVAFVVTNMVGVVVGMKIVLGNHIFWIVALSCIPALLSVIIAFFFHESPKYLVLKKHDKEAADRAIRFYQKTNDTQTSEAMLSIEGERDESSAGIWSTLSNRHTLFGLLLGIACMQLTASIWPILYFSTEFLSRAGIHPETSELVSTIMLVVSSLTTIGGMVIVERFSRRKLFLLSSSLNVAALLLFVICERLSHSYHDAKYGCIAAVVLHGTSYSVALGPIAWFITAELVPLSSRALCQSIALSVNQFTVLILCFITLPLYNQIGSWIIFLLFVLPGVVCIIFLALFLPETREKNIDQVIDQMSDKLTCLNQVKSPKIQSTEMDVKKITVNSE